MGFEITPAHQAIFDAIKSKRKNLVIEAVAGAGKTSTLVEAMRCIPSSETTVFLAFNKTIADELARRVPPHVEARTLNSLGNRAWARYLKTKIGFHGRHVVDADKVTKILAQWEDDGRISGPQRRTFGYPASRLVRFAKQLGIVVDDDGKEGGRDGLLPDEATTWAAIVDNYDVDIPEQPEDALEQVVRMARELLVESVRMTETIDFDDQIYMPFVYDIDCFRFDRVLVDELQDLTPLQHDFVARVLKRNGQIVGCGDPWQACYGFRGADTESMQNFAEAFDAEKLPLHVSYRCPKTVVEVCQAIVPHILAHDSAPDGRVDLTPLWWEKADFVGGDFIVCRTVAPLIALAYGLIRKSVPVEVLGRDIGKNLEALAKRCDKDGTVDGMLEKLDKWEAKEVERAVKKGMDGKVAQIEDKCDTLRILCEGQTRVPDVLAMIASLFTGDRSSSHRVTLSTVHKAKGLEADRVWILNQHLMPHKMAKKPWAQIQEKCLIYIARSRARRELRGLAGPDGKSRAS